MPFFVHFQEYRCVSVKWHSDADQHRFTLKVVREGSAYCSHDLTITLDKDCCELSYSLPSAPRMAYHFDFSIQHLNCEKASALLERYLINRAGHAFAEVNGDVFYYVLMLADTTALDDYTNDPFTFRCISERLKCRQPIYIHSQCNRHAIVLATLAEHIANFDDELAATHKKFIQHAFITPAIYKWLQSVPLYRIAIGSEYRSACIKECKSLSLLLCLSLKERHQLLTLQPKFETLIELGGTSDRINLHQFLINELPFIELYKLQTRIHVSLFSYLSDIAAMVHNGRDVIAPVIPRSASELILFHDLLVEHINATDQADNEMVKKALAEDTEFPLSPMPNSSLLELIERPSQIVAEGREMGHCIASQRYILKLLSGHYFAYRVCDSCRATALLKYASGQLNLIEISGVRNEKVASHIVRDVELEIENFNRAVGCSGMTLIANK